MVRTAEDASGEDLVRVYLREIGRHRLLAADQEIEVAKAIEAGNEAAKRLARANGSLSARTRDQLQRQVDAGERAKRTFVEANLRLVVFAGTSGSGVVHG